MKLYSQEVRRSPADLPSRNNLALVALLLDAKEAQPFDLAREVYQKSPTNANFASTYAFALLVREKNAEALKIIESLKTQDLQSPGIAGYYGLILQATGNGAKAKKYLNLAVKGRLLPEERKLFERAGGSAL